MQMEIEVIYPAGGGGSWSDPADLRLGRILTRSFSGQPSALKCWWVRGRPDLRTPMSWRNDGSGEDAQNGGQGSGAPCFTRQFRR